MSGDMYSNPFVIKLAELYERHSDKMKVPGVMGILLKAVKPEIPGFLCAMDQNEQMRGAVEKFIVELAAVVEQK